MFRVFATLALAALCAQPVAAGAAPPKEPAGGAMQMKAAEGCMNQWISNDVWRLRVKSVEPITDGSWPGWGVNVEFRNRTHGTVELGNTGVQGGGIGVQLVTDDGNAMTLNDLDYQRLGYRDAVQGGMVAGQLKYHFPAGADTNVKPTKFIVEIDPKQSTKARYKMHDPSFRVNLTCSK